MVRTPTLPVIVGIDGSKHAVRAAIWACDEALRRNTMLRLVYVIASDVDDLQAEFDDARLALGEARAAVESMETPVEMTSEILRGDPATRVIESSRTAGLVCIGANGMHDSAPGHRGATGATITESAFCPVVMVRHRRAHRHAPGERWVVAVLDESPVSISVMRTALDEALRRDASVLALIAWPARNYGSVHSDDDLRAELDRYLLDSGCNEPDVGICVAPVPENLTDLLAQTADLDQLVIVGKSNPNIIAELVGPQARSKLRKTNCSVMILRDELDTVLAAS